MYLMTLLKIMLITIGIAFTLFGYKIYFQKRYNLINGFEDAYKVGRKIELYAKKAVLVEFVLGIVTALIGICEIIIK